MATPTDLVRDTRTTPFNIGRRIELHDFTAEEAAPLARGLQWEGQKADLSRPLLARVLYWTNGHPYLTQRFCQAVALELSSGGSPSADTVDKLCIGLFLSTRARERDDNLLFVRERLLRSEADSANLLSLYEQVLIGKPVRDDETNPLVSILRLSGIVREEQGQLVERNRIYERAFDRDWVRQSLPDAEVRRQKAAYRRGLVRATSIAAVFVFIITALAVVALRQSREAKRQREENRQRLVRVNVASGLTLMDHGDTLGALPWFVEALRLETRDSPQEQVHRMRIAAVLEQSPTLLQVWFHEAAVNAAEFNPEGDRVLTASGDGRACVWDTATGRLLVTAGHGDNVKDAVFSSDGLRLATASADATARVWEVATGHPMSPPLLHTGAVNSIRFSPDGRSVLTASDDNTAQVWDARTGERLGPSLQHRGLVAHATFSPDGQRAVTIGRDAWAKVWEVPAGRLVSSASLPNQWVKRASFSPDGRRVIVAMWGGVVCFDAETGAPPAALATSKSYMTSASFSPDGQWVVISSDDQTVRVVKAATGEAVAPAIRHSRSVNYAEFSPDARTVVTACRDGTAQVWNVLDSTPIGPKLKHGSSVLRACFSPDGGQVLTASADGQVKLWDMTTVWPVLRRLQHDSVIRHITVCQDGRLLATGSHNSTARVWEAATGHPLTPPFTHKGPVVDATLRPERGLLLTASLGGQAGVWDIASGHSMMLSHTNPVFGVGFSPDGQEVITLSSEGAHFGGNDRFLTITNVIHLQRWRAATGQPAGGRMTLDGSGLFAMLSPLGDTCVTCGPERTLLLWDAANGRRICAPIVAGFPVSSVSFSRDGRLFVGANGDHPSFKTDKRGKGGARIWEARTGRPMSPLLPHPAGVRSAAFTFDGLRLVTASDDGVARVWDVHSGKLLLPPLPHAKTVRAASFSPDGRLLATACEDGAVRLWDTSTGELIGPPVPNSAWVENVLFCGDGQTVVSSLWERTVGVCLEKHALIWKIPKETRPMFELQSLAEALTSHRIHTWGILVPLSSTQSQCAWHSARATQPADRAALLAKRLAWYAEQAEATNNASNQPIAATQLRLVDEALLLEPANSVRWVEKAKLLERGRRSQEALVALDKAIALVSVRTNNSAASLAEALLKRSAILQQLGRHTEAGADRALGLPVRASGIPSNLIDLSLCYNARLDKTWEDERPETDATEAVTNTYNLANLPQGRSTFDSVEFDVRGLVLLSASVGQNFQNDHPVVVTNIPIEQTARRLHFLHAAGWFPGQKTRIGSYDVHYTDGIEVEVPLIYGDNVRNCVVEAPPRPPPTNAVVAWTGTNTFGTVLQLFHAVWENPRPSVTVQSLDFRSTVTRSVPVLVAITAEP